MLKTVAIQNFRGLRELRLDGLGRVNLLVGGNNTGKTSVLEALLLLTSGGGLSEVTSSLIRRGEGVASLQDASPASSSAWPMDVRFLFHGRTLEDVWIVIEGQEPGGERLSISVSAPRVPPDDAVEMNAWHATIARRATAIPAAPDRGLGERETAPRFLEIRSGDAVLSRTALNLGGSLNVYEAFGPRADSAKAALLLDPQVSHSQPALAQFFDHVVLKNEEATVLAALQAIEPSATKIAAVQSGASQRSVVVSMGRAEPVPLGNLGDGMGHMLAIAVWLVAAKDGYLLIDEIDNGLHHTVMQKMWKLVFETAKRLNVAVFATTHSYDCVQALSAIARPDIRENGDVALIRVERDRTEGVHFSEEEITRLAEREIEAR